MDSEDDDFYEIKFLDGNDLESVEQIVLDHQIIDIPNAIALNEAMVAQLRGLIAKLETSIEKCQKKYEANELLLQYLDEKSKGSIDNRKSLIEKCPGRSQLAGWPYFKTLSGKSAPLNSEAVYRKSLNTIYPYDINRVIRRQWTMGDKTLLLRLVKDSVLAYGRQDPDLNLHSRMKLEKLIDSVNDSPFAINWERISDELYNRHSPQECLGMWNLVFHPNLKRGTWTAAEDDLLLEVVQKYSFQNWETIAAEMSTPRSMFQCFLRYQTTFMMSGTRTMAKFTAAEDKQILELVEKYRVGRKIPWTTISQHMPNRTRQTIYYRYAFSLRPDISRERFSVEEDCMFVAAIHEYGLDFQKIAQEFPNRTVVQLRAHYNNVIKKNAVNNPWTVEEDEKLMELAEKGSSWAEIADVIKTQTRQKCRTRHGVIKQFLEKNKDLTIKNVPRRKRAPKNGVTSTNWVTKLTQLSEGLPEEGTEERETVASNADLIKLVSYAQLLDIGLTEETLKENSDKFTETEIRVLEAALKVDPSELVDIPMHKATLEGFDRVRNFLGENRGEENPKTYSKIDKVAKDNFKKQFKALFYLPAIMANIQGDSDKKTTVIDSQFGPITVTY